jgi:hypothetical protein
MLRACIGASVTKKGYQLRINILKDKKSDLVADSHSILARWRNHFFQLLNIQRDNDVRQREIHTAEPMPEPSAIEVELAIERVKSHKSPGIDQIPRELRQGVEQFAMRSINLFLFGVWRNCMRSGRGQSFYLSIRRVINCNYRGILLSPPMYNLLSNCAVKVNSICRGNYWGSSVWILMQQVNYRSYISHSSNS